MKNMEETLRIVYSKLGDEVSKEIFANRLLYNTFGEKKYLDKVIETVPGGGEHIERLFQLKQSKKKLYIYGTGFTGKELWMSNSCYPWEAFIDTNPKSYTCCGLPVVSYSDFIATYNGGVVFVASRLSHKEIFDQLVNGGVPQSNIVYYGKTMFDLANKQYFDLPYIDFNKNNVFVDCGSFDGLTAIEFAKKARGGGVFMRLSPIA